jgi:hypothetical protein
MIDCMSSLSFAAVAILIALDGIENNGLCMTSLD